MDTPELQQEDQPEQTDNRPRPEDGEQLPPEANGDEWTGEDMR